MKASQDKHFFVEDMALNNGKLKACYVRENCYSEWDEPRWLRFHVFLGNQYTLMMFLWLHWRFSWLVKKRVTHFRLIIYVLKCTLILKSAHWRLWSIIFSVSLTFRLLPRYVELEHPDCRTSNRHGEKCRVSISVLIHVLRNFEWMFLWSL